MSYIVQCPLCKANLRAKVKPTTEVSCPKCNGVILPAAEPIPEQVVADVAEEEQPAEPATRLRQKEKLDDHEEEHRRRRRADRERDDDDEPRGRRRGKDLVLLNDRDAFVSTTRITLRGTTYATANVTSVKLRYDNRAKVRTINWGLVLTALGGTAGFAFHPLWAIAVVGVLVLIVGLCMSGWYSVILATAAGEFTGFRSQNGRFCNRLADAIEDAMLERG